jgi:hypothetical protein
MGLPFGPGCGDSSLDLDMPMLGLGCGIFGCNGACHLFGGCSPPALPKPSSPPLPGPTPPPPSDCGPLGCGGYCNVKGGCKPCPPQICGGPQCTRLGGCGPSPGPMPPSVRPSGTPDPAQCEEAQKTTVTERFVVCTEGFELKPTTIASINFTISELITSTCLPLYEATLTACGIMGWTSTTTATSLTSSTAPACMRAPLSLDDDEGDNPAEEPAPTCTRAPLLIDEDEGDNAPSCTQAPLLIDDDEGDDERKPTPTPSPTSSRTTSWDAPPSTLSEGPVETTLQPPTITPPSQTSSSPPAMPTDCTWPWCNCCRATYADCVSLWCKPDGSNAAYCARICLTVLCTFEKSSPEICRVGLCRLSACPKEPPRNIEDGQPAAPFTTVLRLPATTVTVTLMPSSSSTPLPSVTSLPPVTPITSVPQCTPGSISPTSQWQVQIEHFFDVTGVQLKWDLYDHNGCHAGAGKDDKLRIDQSAESGAGDVSAAVVMAGSFSNISIAGPGSSVQSLSLPLSPSDAPVPPIEKRHDPREYVGTEIASSNRPVQDSMYYKVDARVLDPMSYSTRTVFTLQRSAADCATECHPTFEIGDGTAKVPYYITKDCHSACNDRPAITNADVGCNDGANVLHRITLPTGKTAFRRQFWCWWRMPTVNRTLRPNATWRIRLRHEMEYATALVTWTLIDANGFEAGTGKVAAFSETNSIQTDISSSSLRHGADALAVPIRLTVIRPTVEQDTWLELEFGKTGPNCHERCYPVLNTFSNRHTTGRPENAIQGWTWVTTCGINCEKDIIAKPSTDCGFHGEPFAVQGAGRVREFECWFTAY